MSTTSGRPREPGDLMQTLAHHDAAINSLGGRMSGVETGLRTLQGEVHHGFAAITQTVNTQLGAVSSKLDKLDAAPKFDVHRTVGTVVALAVLFSMICGGIIWITTNQFSGVIAEQRSFNGLVGQRLDKHEIQIEKLNGWTTTTSPATMARGAR